MALVVAVLVRQWSYLFSKSEHFKKAELTMAASTVSNSEKVYEL